MCNGLELEANKHWDKKGPGKKAKGPAPAEKKGVKITERRTSRGEVMDGKGERGLSARCAAVPDSHCQKREMR